MCAMHAMIYCFADRSARNRDRASISHSFWLLSVPFLHFRKNESQSPHRFAGNIFSYWRNRSLLLSRRHLLHHRRCFHLSRSVLAQTQHIKFVSSFSNFFRLCLFRVAAAVHLLLRDTFVCSCSSLPASVTVDLIPYWPVYALCIWIFPTHTRALAHSLRAALSSKWALHKWNAIIIYIYWMCASTHNYYYYYLVGIHTHRAAQHRYIRYSVPLQLIYMYILYISFLSRPELFAGFFPVVFFLFFALWKYFPSFVSWCHSSLCAGVHQSVNALVRVHYPGAFRLFFDYLAYDDGK